MSLDSLKEDSYFQFYIYHGFFIKLTNSRILVTHVTFQRNIFQKLYKKLHDDLVNIIYQKHKDMHLLHNRSTEIQYILICGQSYGTGTKHTKR